jgi:hypothetical protein
VSILISFGTGLISGSFVSSWAIDMLVSAPFFKNDLKFGTFNGGFAPTPLKGADI